jgi:Cdc6-like AAA superfamily ATPase
MEMITTLRKKIQAQIDHMLEGAIILDRRFLDDEQLSRDEQKEVLGEIFDENVRQKEIQELSRHFSAVMGKGECIPVLGVYGSTGTGKSVTNRRLNSISVAISTSLNWVFWNLESVLPNRTRLRQ